MTTQPATQHVGCNCAAMGALVDELTRRLDAHALILVAAYEADGMTPPAELGPVAAARPVKAVMPSGRTPLVCIPGGAA